MKTFSFEKLEVWKDTKAFIVIIYQLTKRFPDDERFGLISQIRRALISVSSNIAEGSSRATSKDQAYFYNIAFSSLMEVHSQLLISIELNYIPREKEEMLRDNITMIANKINALRAAILKKS